MKNLLDFSKLSSSRSGVQTLIIVCNLFVSDPALESSPGTFSSPPSS
jgi:hypothetical protein